MNNKIFKEATEKFFTESELKRIQEYVYALHPKIVKIEGEPFVELRKISMKGYLGKELYKKVIKFQEKIERKEV